MQILNNVVAKKNIPIFSVQTDGSEPTEESTSYLLIGINNINPEDYRNLESFVLNIEDSFSITAEKIGENNESIVYAAYTKGTNDNESHLGLLTLIPSLLSFKLELYF